MTLFILTISTLLAAAVQARLPTLWWLGGLRLELVPAAAAYMALRLPWRQAVGMSVLAGLAQDALSGAPFGVSALAYSTVAMGMNLLREIIDPDLPVVHVAAAAAMSAVGSLAAFCVVGVSFGYAVKLLLVAVLAGVAAPPVFIALHGLSRSMTGART